MEGFRRVFAHTAPVFFERGIANSETREISSLSCEEAPGRSIVVAVFDIEHSPTMVQARAVASGSQGSFKTRMVPGQAPGSSRDGSLGRPEFPPAVMTCGGSLHRWTCETTELNEKGGVACGPCCWTAHRIAASAGMLVFECGAVPQRGSAPGLHLTAARRCQLTAHQDQEPASECNSHCSVADC